MHIKNLEQLYVEQIQEIQDFVKRRNGIFDFNTYSFSIQKKIEFKEFTELIKRSNIAANCRERLREREVQPRVGFGQYKGMQYSELPNSYMLWLKTNYRGRDRDIIDKELQRRNI